MRSTNTSVHTSTPSLPCSIRCSASPTYVSPIPACAPATCRDGCSRCCASLLVHTASSNWEALTPDPVTGRCELHTIEVFDELEDFLRDVMSRAGDLGKLIHLHFGDALQIIPQLEGPFDVVFIDADKRIYDQYFELVLPLTRPGGLILADNTLWDGKVLNPNPPESDTQTIGLQRFNDLIARDTRVQKVILPMRDGLTLIRKL